MALRTLLSFSPCLGADPQTWSEARDSLAAGMTDLAGNDGRVSGTCQCTPALGLGTRPSARLETKDF